jgi:guanylate kinase
MTPILITLTGPTCGGKTTIHRELVDHYNVRPIVSTTTRAPRVGEVDGKDYYFITEEQSHEIERLNGFAELVTFNGTRYGVTRDEMRRFKGHGIGVVILEPNGVRQYRDLSEHLNFRQFTVFITCHTSTRVDRLKARFLNDLNPLVAEGSQSGVERTVNIYVKRLHAALTEETFWVGEWKWDLKLDTDRTTPPDLARSIMEAVHAQ